MEYLAVYIMGLVVCEEKCGAINLVMVKGHQA